METFIQILKSDVFLISMFIINIILLIAIIINSTKLSKLNNKYQTFMKKLGNGKNIEEDLENYIYRVKNVEERNAEIYNYIRNIEEDMSKCIQKVGIVRYSAFKDTGSDLSFAVALLDENNDGIILNGIYSREISNIYAKPVKDGKSSYTVSEEEQEAIRKAIDSNNRIIVD